MTLLKVYIFIDTYYVYLCSQYYTFTRTYFFLLTMPPRALDWSMKYLVFIEIINFYIYRYIDSYTFRNNYFHSILFSITFCERGGVVVVQYYILRGRERSSPLYVYHNIFYPSFCLSDHLRDCSSQIR